MGGLFIYGLIYTGEKGKPNQIRIELLGLVEKREGQTVIYTKRQIERQPL